MPESKDDYLAWFLGPKGENSRYFEEILNDILRDYTHWRKNYFPEDDLLISKSQQKQQVFEERVDSLYHNVYKMMGYLKRNFPFYSPRYMAHMLSDITMPSMLGYFAGMLFNANNVTSEASPVAGEWEIKASNALIQMIGYTMSPKPPSIREFQNANADEWKKLHKDIQGEFAWGHITAGGTISNIEALWVARNVKFLSLGLLEAYLNIKAGKYNIKDTGGKLRVGRIIPEFDHVVFSTWKKTIRYKQKEELRILNLPTKRAIELLQEFYNCIEFETNSNNTAEDLKKKIKAGLNLLSNTKYYTDLPGLLSRYQPIIFMPRTAHYSINKAVDILGIPRNNVRFIDIDTTFRMKTDMLAKELQNIKSNNKFILDTIKRDEEERLEIPLMVIGVCGTTEEGAVDPIHKIIEVREKFHDSDPEKVYDNLSFWIHADAAYGGLFACLLRIKEFEKHRFHKEKLVLFLIDMLNNKKLNGEQLESYEELKEIIKKGLIEKLDGQVNEILNNILVRSIKLYAEITMGTENFSKKEPILNEMIAFEKERDNEEEIKKARNKFKEIEIFIYGDGPNNEDIDTDPERYVLRLKNCETELWRSYIQGTDKLRIEDIEVDNEYDSIWKDESIIKSFENLKEVDSVTIDPHKMGYVQYPCGFVAFKNDKVRNFIQQGAPYITSSETNVLNHKAPRHLEKIDMAELSEGGPPCKEGEYKIAIDAFAPYILEGSKPAAAAASLWLTTQVIKLDIHNYGQMIINSMRSANDLYIKIRDCQGEIVGQDIKYRIYNLTDAPPDTNVIVFFMKAFSKSRNYNNLEFINKATDHVYNKFHISAEHGDMKTSYSQEFFISQTTMKSSVYNIDSLEAHTKKGGAFFYEKFEKDYEEHGLIVLRMAVMNPYIHSYKVQNGLDLIAKFIKEIDNAMQSFSFENKSISNEIQKSDTINDIEPTI